MNEQRRQVLQMLSEGKIDAEQAERLLDALTARESPPPTKEPGQKCKTLHVIVHQHGPGAQDKVHVKVPLVILKAGMKLKSVMPNDIREKIGMRLSAKGIDMEELNLDKLENILEALKEGSIDIENGDEKIHIFCD